MLGESIHTRQPLRQGWYTNQTDGFSTKFSTNVNQSTGEFAAWGTPQSMSFQPQQSSGSPQRITGGGGFGRWKPSMITAPNIRNGSKWKMKPWWCWKRNVHLSISSSKKGAHVSAPAVIKKKMVLLFWRTAVKSILGPWSWGSKAQIEPLRFWDFEEFSKSYHLATTSTS